MSTKLALNRARKPWNWRSATVSVLLGFVSALLLWVCVIWIALKME